MGKGFLLEHGRVLILKLDFGTAFETRTCAGQCIFWIQVTWMWSMKGCSIFLPSPPHVFPNPAPHGPPKLDPQMVASLLISCMASPSVCFDMILIDSVLDISLSIVSKWSGSSSGNGKCQVMCDVTVWLPRPLGPACLAWPLALWLQCRIGQLACGLVAAEEGRRADVMGPTVVPPCANKRSELGPSFSPCCATGNGAGFHIFKSCQLNRRSKGKAEEHCSILKDKSNLHLQDIS